MRLKHDIGRIVAKAIRLSVFLGVHLVCTLMLILTVEAARFVVSRFGETRTLDLFPLSYIFDGIDLIMCLAFVWLSVSEMRAIMREDDGE